MKLKLISYLIGALFVSSTLFACHGGSNSVPSSRSQLNKSFGNATNVTNQHWHYTYNNMKLLETATDPNGNVTRYSYDGQGQISKITNALNQSVQFGDYSADGHPQTITDANGVVSKNTYTVDGWLSSSITDGAETRFEYDNVGQLTKITKPDGSYLKYTYDGARRLTETSDNSGVVKYSYDEASNMTSMEIHGKSGLAFEEDFLYDAMNRLTMDWGDYSNKLRMYQYDNDDNVTKFYKEGVGETEYNYDSLQRLVNSTASDGATTKYAYNNSSNLSYPSSVTDTRDNKTLYSYNGLSNLLKLVSPDSGTHTNTAYDGNGNLLSQVDARGEQINYSYDALNRPKEINYAADDSLDTTFTYDQGTNGVGRLTKVQNEVSTNSYYYDARGNTLSEIQRINNNDYILKYGYDKADNLTNIVYPSNTQVVYGYSNGRVSKVTVNGKIVAEVSHMPFGPIDQINYGNNVENKISYDTNYIQTGYSLSNSLLNRQNKIVNGQINAISGIGSFFYDKQSRVNLFMNEDYSYMQFYYYDSLGNLTSFNEYGGDIKISYNTAPNSNRIISKTTLNNDDEPIATINYSYDNAGNMIKAGSTNYIYNSLNQLQSVAVDDLKKNSKEIASYQYNSFSQRIMKNLNGNKTIFIYNSAGKLLEERDLQTNSVRDYIYVEGKLIAATENGIIVYIVTDHLNSPQIVMDGSGKQIWKADYQSFGQAKITGYLKLNLRADGQYEDDETGLYYNWYRYYNPDLGRYITSDPLGLAAGMNTYIYVNGNPINYTDPMGLMGGGLGVAAYAEGGIMIMGAGATVSGGVGGFWGGQYGFNLGGFVSGGTYIGGSFPLGDYRYGTQEPFGGQNNFALGGAAGVSPFAFVTNATCAEDLKGISKTYSVNTKYGSVQFGYGNGTGIVSFLPPLPSNISGKISFGGGADISGYATKADGWTFWK